ncbi:uncharacterized protein [Nicotiana sylvestris]|uniref:uncharacterized protein n=1 Tax=Nicotiana sylvestris TaxID=4096 RepID=UPI00388CB90D
MHTRFTSIINELHSLGYIIPRNKLIRKFLSVLSGSWESKVNAITEAKDLQTLTMDELISNRKTYEMKGKKDSERRDPKKEKNLVLKAESSESMKIVTWPILLRDFKRWSNTSKILTNQQKGSWFQTNDSIEKSAADNIVKQALAAWEDSFSEFEREPDVENISTMALETEATNLVNDKEILTIELRDTEQSRDNLMVCVVGLNGTIANLEKEKEALSERITSVKNKRDDLMVVVVDLKETIEGLSNEKHTLEGKITTTEEERDDLLVICTDQEETIEGLNREHRNVSLGKGKEVATKTHILIEKELTVVKTSLCSELEKNQQLQAELEKVRIDLEKSLKWSRFSSVVTSMYLNNSRNRQGIGFQREKLLTTLKASMSLYLITGYVPIVEIMGILMKLPGQSSVCSEKQSVY